MFLWLFVCLNVVKRPCQQLWSCLDVQLKLSILFLDRLRPERLMISPVNDKCFNWKSGGERMAVEVILWPYSPRKNVVWMNFIFLIKYKLHWVTRTVYMNPFGVYSPNTRTKVVYTSIKIREMKNEIHCFDKVVYTSINIRKLKN